MIFMYKFLLKLIKFFLPILRLIPHKKVQYYLNNQGRVTLKASILNPLWIHASSGEIEYAKPLIRELKLRYPHLPVLVTHTSLSSLKSLESLNVEAYGVSPLDEPTQVKQFLNKYRPRACLIARTDLWPVTLIELHKTGIPTYLFSATFSIGMKKTSWLSRQLLQTALPLLRKVFFVSSKDQFYCSQFFHHISGEIMGDTRYDQVLFRLSENSRYQWSPFEKLLIAGSTWAEDEAPLIRATSELKKWGWKWMLVPHEVNKEHIDKLERECKKFNLRTKRFSQSGTDFQWSEIDALIVDKVGMLASLYPLAKIAFVGGSFRKQVHSVMEALAAGLPVIVGPFHHNSREALEFKELGFVREVIDDSEILQAIKQFEANLPETKSQLTSIISSKTGATLKLIDFLKAEGLLEENAKT